MSLVRDPNGPSHGAVTWEGDLPAPLTTYASTQYTGAQASRLQVPASTSKSRSAAVSRRDRLNGLRFFYSHGATRMPINSLVRPASNGVQSSAYNQYWVNLFDRTLNLAWYIAYPRNLGLSFRMPQPQTNKTGGPTPAMMQQRPLFNRVQRVPRYSVVPQTYNTTGSKA